MNFINEILGKIDIILIALVLLGGVFAKNYMSSIKLSNVYKTLIMGSLFSLVYMGILYASGKFAKDDLVKYFFSYCVATSLYELLLRYAFDFIGKKLGVSTQN